VGVPAPTALGGPPSREPALLSVEGRAHAVQLHYAAAPVADYVRAAVEAAVGVHQEGLPGDVLIFLTGQEECERAVGMLEEEDRRLAAAARGRGGGGGGGGGRARLLAAPLHAGLPPAAQLAALQPPPRGARKVSAHPPHARTHALLCLFCSFFFFPCVHVCFPCPERAVFCVFLAPSSHALRPFGPNTLRSGPNKKGPVLRCARAPNSLPPASTPRVIHFYIRYPPILVPARLNMFSQSPPPPPNWSPAAGGGRHQRGRNLGDHRGRGLRDRLPLRQAALLRPLHRAGKPAGARAAPARFPFASAPAQRARALARARLVCDFVRPVLAARAACQRRAPLRPPLPPRNRAHLRPALCSARPPPQPPVPVPLRRWRPSPRPAPRSARGARAGCAPATPSAWPRRPTSRRWRRRKRCPRCGAPTWRPRCCSSSRWCAPALYTHRLKNVVAFLSVCVEPSFGWGARVLFRLLLPLESHRAQLPLALYHLSPSPPLPRPLPPPAPSPPVCRASTT
jgi:hypothetical protein